jgi:regulator of nonsense transcripts 1
MLCNQSMLSAGFTRVVPIRTVIVDEASQIEVGEYLPMLSQFQSSLQKLVFIGDDKQRMDSCCGRLITFSPFM